MNRNLLIGLIAVFVAGSIAGCGRVRIRARVPNARVTVRANTPPPAANATVRVNVGSPSAGAGVTVVDNYCQAGAAEVCNGLDDNCNGVIDEGCGYSTGNIQITLGWGTGADLDMYVTDPSGFTISYQNPRSPSGGHLDHDARGDCTRRQQNATVENVYWDAASPPSGQYQVEVHYWGDCNTASTTQATVSVAVGGQIMGAYNIALNPRDRLPVVLFNMP